LTIAGARKLMPAGVKEPGPRVVSALREGQALEAGRAADAVNEAWCRMPGLADLLGTMVGMASLLIVRPLPRPDRHSA
jgi:hypothetical protein